jgi:serine/threonine-protein kinase
MVDADSEVEGGMGAGIEQHARLGPYRVLRRVGSGGMGTVFEAEDTALGHRVAVKLLHPHLAGRPGAVQRFLREGRAAARIRHPNVVQVFALGIEGEIPYLAMELLQGDDLSVHIAREGRLSVEAALDLVLSVVGAVAAAHEAGVIHRDLKPSNVCLSRGPGGQACPKVVDFGVSKVVTGDCATHVTVSNSVVGTTAYMAPEQVRGANTSFWSDQYSLAAMLYQCITGELPFSGGSVYEIMESIITTPLAAPSARASGSSAALDTAVLRAMSRNPEHRFPTVRAFGAALLPLASERTRLALRAEFDDCTGDPALTDTGSAVTRDVFSRSTDPDLTTLGETPSPTPSRSGPTATSSRSIHRLWPLAVAFAVGLAGMAFGREPTGAPPDMPQASPAASEGRIAHDPRHEGEGVSPRAISQASIVSAASAPLAVPSPETSTARNLVAAPSLETHAPRPYGRPQRQHAPRDVSPAVTLGDNGSPILP